MGQTSEMAHCVPAIGHVPPKGRSALRSASFDASNRPFWAGLGQKQRDAGSILKALCRRAWMKHTEKEVYPCPNSLTETSIAATGSALQVSPSRSLSSWPLSSLFQCWVAVRQAILPHLPARPRQTLRCQPHRQARHRCLPTKTKNHHSCISSERLRAFAFLRSAEATICCF